MPPTLARWKQPTQKQFHEAISRGADAWYGACFRITGDRSLAEDAVQDALLQSWRKRRNFRGSAKLETWIHRIAINSALSILRKQAKLNWTELLDTIEADNPTPLEYCVTGDVRSELTVALNELSPLERACFVLKHLEEWRLTEISEQLGIGVGPVKQALFRALKKLRLSMSGLKGNT